MKRILLLVGLILALVPRVGVAADPPPQPLPRWLLDGYQAIFNDAAGPELHSEALKFGGITVRALVVLGNGDQRRSVITALLGAPGTRLVNVGQANVQPIPPSPPAVMLGEGRASTTFLHKSAGLDCACI